MHRDRAVTRVEDPAATRRSAGLKVRRAVLGCVTVAAAVGVAFAGFASSSSGKTRTNAPAHVASGIKGLYGSLPPVGTPTKGGTITIGQLQGATPDFIFPIWPAADNTAYTASFVYTMFLPLYNAPNGGTPEIDYAVSVAKPPIFSDGNKTVTINMRTNYKWANGQPVDANDVLFFVALVKQAVKESAANWSAYSPGLFPDSLASISAPSKYTIVMHLKRAFNPGYFLDDQLQGLVYPLPSTAWNIASTGGPHINFNDPANAKKIYDYLAKQGGDVATFGTDPLWKDVDGPFALTSFSATNSSYDQKANPFFGGSPAQALHIAAGHRDLHRHNPAAQRAAYRQPRHRRSRLLPARLGREPARRGIQHLRLPRPGLVRRGLQLQGQDRPLQLDHRPAVHPRGVRAPGRPAGIPHRHLQERRRARVRADPDGAADPVHAGQCRQGPLPLRSGRGGGTAQEPRLARRAKRADDLRQGGKRGERMRRRHSGRHPPEVHVVLHPGLDHARERARVRGVRL